jgi:dynein heavy chain
MQPVLIQTSKEVEEQTVIVEREAGAANIVAERVGADEAVAAKSAAEADAIKQECKRELDNAIPMKLAAEEALKSISKKDITEIKTVASPHVDVKMVLSGVMILLEVPPEKKMDPATQKRETDYWGPAQK